MMCSARICCGAICRCLMTCVCRWCDARCCKCRTYETPRWFDVTALWQMLQGNLGLRGPGFTMKLHVPLGQFPNLVWYGMVWYGMVWYSVYLFNIIVHYLHSA